MKKSIIAAVSENNVIGLNNKIPWHLPSDLKLFKKLTHGRHIIMGRKTHESIGKPLSGRKNIILTGNKNYKCHKDCIILHSIKDSLNFAESNHEKEVFVIGGAEIYKKTLRLADRIYLTKVLGNFEGDTFFPKIDLSEWKTVSRTFHKVDSQNPYPHKFLVLDKK